MVRSCVGLDRPQCTALPEGRYNRPLFVAEGTIKCSFPGVATLLAILHDLCCVLRPVVSV